MEFKQQLSVLKDRAGKLAKEEEAFKDALVSEFNANEADDESTAVGSPKGGEVNLDDGVEGSSLGDGSEVLSQYSRSSRLSRRSEERRPRGDGKPEWDASTCTGEERTKVSETDQDVAREVLENNQKMRAVHSKESVQKMIQKQREQLEQMQD